MLYLRPDAHEELLPLRQHTAIEGKTCGKISLVRPFAGACGLPSPDLCLWRFASALDKLGRIVHTISDPGETFAHISSRGGEDAEISVLNLTFRRFSVRPEAALMILWASPTRARARLLSRTGRGSFQTAGRVCRKRDVAWIAEMERRHNEVH